VRVDEGTCPYFRARTVKGTRCGSQILYFKEKNLSASNALAYLATPSVTKKRRERRYVVTKLIGVASGEAFAIDVHERLGGEAAVGAVAHEAAVPFLGDRGFIYNCEVWRKKRCRRWLGFLERRDTNRIDYERICVVRSNPSADVAFLCSFLDKISPV